MTRVMCIDGGALRLVEREAAPPGPEEVAVRVRAAGVNRADILQRKGVYPAPPGAVQDVPGLEFAGEVVACGARVQGVAPGDRVMGIVAGGGYSERLCVHHRALLPVPAGLSWAEAAAIPEAFSTAYDALVLQAGLSPGHRVLIHAVGSGVGTAASQIAAAWGATVIGTSRTAGKLARAADLGLHHGVVPEAGAFAEAVRGLGPVHVVLDLVGGPYTAESLGCMAPGGVLVLVGLMAGLTCEMPLAVLLKNRLQVRGTVLRARPIEEKIALARSFAAHGLPLFERGALRPIVDAVYPMAEVEAAHRHMLSNALVGKLVLEWPAD